MRIGFIPGPLDALSGEGFPHFIHMIENVRALREKAEIDVLNADRANRKYMKFQKSRLYSLLSYRYMDVIRKLFHFLFFLKVYVELKKNIREKQNDLFLVRFSFSNYFISRYLHLKGHKILLEAHALANVQEKEYGQSYVPPFYFMVVTFLERKILSWAQEVITVSESLKDSLINLGIDEEKIHVIPNAVDLDKFNYLIDPKDIIREHNLEEKIIIGFVGSFARYHGLEILLRVAKNLEKNYDNITFLLVGRNVHGSDDPMQKVDSTAVSHLFKFTGEVSHSEVPSYIAAMDIAIIPDSNTYGSPMKLFEYMAMKKAIVAADVPPVREVIVDRRTGILFKKGSAAEATEAVETLIDNERLRRELGWRAYAKVIGFHTWDQNAQKIVEIAKSMME